MNHLFRLLLLASITFLSCAKDDIPVVPDETETLLTPKYRGNFTGINDYTVEGTATIGLDAKGKTFLRLEENFTSSFAAGSVAVYLSQKENLDLKDQTSFISVGVISKNGLHNFEIDFFDNTFKYVIIWCSSAGLPFGKTELMKV